MRWFLLLALPGLLFPASDRKLTDEMKIELLRGLTAEFATAKVNLPRSKKPLPYKADGTWDKAVWEDAAKELGPAARPGDQIQITKVELDKEKITFEINGGIKSGRKWYQNVEVGMGNRTTPIGQNGMPTAGTNIVLELPQSLAEYDVAAIKKLMKPIIDFEKRSATENYIDNLPAPIAEAIKAKRVVEGMDKEQVLMAVGRPRTKTRESNDGNESEDWIYGQPPGRITFVTFEGSKVVKVKESYAGLGGSTAPPLDPK